MADDNPIENIKRYYEGLRNCEVQKNELIERLIEEISSITELNTQLRLDHEREKKYNREGQIRETQLQKEIRDMKAAVDRSQFVLVLIDGDGMVFEDSLLQQGEAGGKEAAGRLWTAVREYVYQDPKLQSLASDYKIVARVYANEKGLGEACCRAGITASQQTIGDFARGFTGSKQLFDFVDVGSGKDRADEKISELFRMNLENIHCRQVFLGCSHDNGYARLLEEVSEHPTKYKVTLLEGVPFERELLHHKARFATHQFKDLFRTTKINSAYPNYGNQASVHHPGSIPGSQPIQLPVRSAVNNGGSPQSEVPYDGMPIYGSSNGYHAPFQESSVRTATTTNNDPTPPMNWASKAGSAPPVQQLASPPATPQPIKPVVPRNRLGQRIDTLSSFDPADFKRIQKIKMCNVHFLRNDCPYGDECTHTHAYKPTKTEVEILRQVARSTPCKYGTDCDDVKCIYGHRCPHSVEGSKTCKFGTNCRFGLDMHGVDTKIVRTTKVA